MIIRDTDAVGGVLLEFTASSGEICQRVVESNVNCRQYLARVDIVSEPGPGPLLVQKRAAYEWVPTLTLTLGTVPVEGHLMLLAVQVPGAITTDLAGLGWTQVAGSVAYNGIYVKVAGPAEPQSVAITTAAAEGYVNGILLEYEQMAESSPFDVAAGSPATGDSTSHSSGTTATTAQELELAVAMFHFGGTAPGGRAYSNGFAEAGVVRTMVVATKVTQAEEASGTTFSWTGLKNTVGMIATFKAAQPTAGPVSPRQYVSKFVAVEVATEVRANLYGHGSLVVETPEPVLDFFPPEWAAIDASQRRAYMSGTLRPETVDAMVRPAGFFVSTFERLED